MYRAFNFNDYYMVVVLFRFKYIIITKELHCNSEDNIITVAKL